MGAARAAGVAVLSEFDLAAAWDDRPIAAITGTNGKTTVTELVADVLDRSGVAAVTAGNTQVPLVEAIDDPEPEWFVVEASSFRLANSRHFAPRVASWLNFAPDHLDVHSSLGSYERAKATIWRDQSSTDVAVANRDDPIVWSYANGPARVVSFGLAEPGLTGPDYGLVDGALVGPGGEMIVRVDELGRSLPHDVANALAAVATAHAAGGTTDAARDALVGFRGLAHRVELIGERDGVRWFDDSKATVPHAVGAAVRGFSSVVLIAGGRNKGLDLSVLGELSPPVRAVIGIGESAGEVVDAFGSMPHRTAASMDDAVDAAASLAAPGDVVVLSPGCASFDWYEGYAARGDDFARSVRARVLRGGGPDT
jgi:UDP-N-acetylmuramoylalanine--D-glutamate ligase